MRRPLYNAFLQNDLDGSGKNVQSVNAVDSVAGNTVYVDQSLPFEIGKIGSTMAFKSLGAALAAAPSNFNIMVRPGTYYWDGIITISRSHIKIFGDGAIVTPITAGQPAGILITGNFVEVHGIEFDGALTGSPSNTGICIEVNRAQNVTLRNLYVHDQHGIGIQMTDDYRGIEISDCTMAKCWKGIIGAQVAGRDIQAVSIKGNRLQALREGGIIIQGDDNVDVFTEIRIVNNDIFDCDKDGTSSPSIEVSHGTRDVLIHGNWCSRSYYGIYVGNSQRIEITANNIFAMNGEMITLSGNQVASVSGNVLDGSNATTGNPLCPIGISMTGYYAVANDAGPYSIVGNLISGIVAAGRFISEANGNNISIVANQFSATATLYAASYDNLLISSNLFVLAGNNPAILLDTAERGTNGGTISGNRFRISGTPARLIRTEDAISIGHVTLNVIGNSSTVGKTYGSGILAAATGALPTNLSLQSNTPVSTTRTSSGYDNRYGWVNDMMPELVPKTLFVSKAVGSDSTGTREARSLPFLTINAAITAASSGDVVRVVDGTFNELVSAKNGVTVRFIDPAKLVSSTAGGCIQTSATDQIFTVYHEHTPMICSSGVSAILMNHTGTYISIHGSVTNTGTGGSTHYVVQGFDGTLEVWGNLSCEDSLCIGNGSGSGSNTLNVILHSVDSNPVLRSDNAAPVDCPILQLTVHGGTIRGATGIKIYPATNLAIFKDCNIVATNASYAPINFGTPNSTFIPIFRNCVLVAGASATASIIVSGAQTILLYGETVANKGANPPTNVTFAGGGTYAVDAAVVADQ